MPLIQALLRARGAAAARICHSSSSANTPRPPKRRIRPRRLGDDAVDPGLDLAARLQLTSSSSIIDMDVAAQRAVLDEVPLPTACPLVITSTSRDPYLNLAFEDWLGRQPDFAARRTLMLWRNRPTVVIGRYQNAWVECDLRALTERGIDLARRKSGGGTVYHDSGNLNLTFVTPRIEHDKALNSDILVDALERSAWQFPVTVNDRNDLVLHGKKISGSAYKLAAHTAFHHCTLLVDSDLDCLRGALQPTSSGISTKGIPSVRSPVSNLADFVDGVTPEALLDPIAQAFARRHCGTDDQLYVRCTISPEALLRESEAFALQVREFRSWAWRCGNGPTFQYDFEVPDPGDPTAGLGLELSIKVHRGAVTAVSAVPMVEMDDAEGHSTLLENDIERLSEALTGSEFRTEALMARLDGLALIHSDVKAAAVEAVRKMT